MNPNSLIAQICKESDYDAWKKRRAEIIHQVEEEIIYFSEAEIVFFYSQLEQDFKNLIYSDEVGSTLQCLHKFSVLYFFQRNMDIIQPYLQILLGKLRSTDKTIVRAVVLTYAWLADDSKLPNLIFREPLLMAQKWLDESNTVFNALMIMKKMRKYLPSELSQLIFSNNVEMCEIASGTDAECQKIALKLLVFQIRQIPQKSFDSNSHTICEFIQQKINSSDENGTYFALKILYCLMKMPKFTKYPDYKIIVEKIQELKKPKIFQCGLKVIFILHTLGVSIGDPNNIIKLILNNFQNITNPTKLLIKSIQVFGDKISYEPILNHYSPITCTKEYDCPFNIINQILTIKPDISVDTSTFDVKYPCQYFVKCIKKRSDFLTQSIKTFLTDPFSHNEPKYLTATLKLYSSFPVFFPDEKELVSIFMNILSSTTDFMLHKQIAKTLSKMKSNEAADLLFNMALTEENKKIRNYSLKHLKPSFYLSTRKYIINLLNDSSFSNRRIAVKLVADLSRISPLEIRHAIVEYAEDLMHLIISTNEAKLCSKYASVLALITKYCLKTSRMLYNTIITVALRAIKETAADHIIDTIENSQSNAMNTITSTESDDPLERSPSASSLTSFAIPSSGSVSNLLVNDHSSSNIKSKVQNPKNKTLNIDEKIDFLQTNEIETAKQNDFAANISKYSINCMKMPSLLLNEKQSMKEPNRAKLYLSMNEKYIDSRDISFMKCFAHLGSLCEAYITQILDCYATIFETRTSNDEILMVAAKTLTKLSLLTYNGLNIRLRCPRMTEPLLNILSNTSNEKLALLLFKLFGSAFDTIDIVTTQATAAENYASPILTDYNEFVIKNILKYSGEFNLTTLRTLVVVVESDPTGCSRFIPKISNVFLYMLKRATPKIRNKIFQYLEVIAVNCHIDFVPLLPQFLPILRHFISLTSCIHFCSRLSYFFKADFILAYELYNLAIKRMKTSDYDYFKELLKFISSMIINQHSSFDTFLIAVEHQQVRPQFVRQIVKSLTTIIQSIDVSTYTSRLIIYGTRVFHLYKLDMIDFFGSLCICCGYPAEQLQRFYESNKTSKLTYASIIELTKMRRDRYHSFEEQNFIKNYKIRFSVPSISSLSPTKPDVRFFGKMQFPTELFMNTWFKNLKKFSFIESPCSAIRACADLLPLRMTRLISKIFPLAFVSSWKEAPSEDKLNFSNIINRMLCNEKFNSLSVSSSKVNINRNFISFTPSLISASSASPTVASLVELIEICDEALLPMDIDMTLVAKVSPNRQYALYVLQRLFIQENKILSNASQLLINVCIKLGRLNTARALLHKYIDRMEPLEIAAMSYDLGDWEKALTIYNELNDTNKIIKCLEKLDLHDEILKYENYLIQTKTMDQGERLSTAENFLMPYFSNKQFDKIESLLKEFSSYGWTSYSLQFAIFYSTVTEHYNAAEDLISLGFRRLAEKRKNISNSDQIYVGELEDEAQILVESQEVLRNKQNKTATDAMTSLWRRRVKYFKRSKEIWRRTIGLRNLLVPISSNLSFYLKFISELRKTHNFSLIDVNFQKPMDMSVDPHVILEQIKLLWAKNRKKEACDAAILYSAISTQLSSPNEFITISKRYKNPLTFNFLYRMSHTSQFNNVIQKFCLQKYSVGSMDEFFNVFYNVSYEEQQQFFRNELLTSFPSILYKCSNELVNDPRYDNFYKASLYRFAGAYITYLYPKSFLSIESATKMLQQSQEITPDSPKLWRSWAYANNLLFRFATNSTESDFKQLEISRDPLAYAQNAVESFLKLTHVSPDDSIEYLCQVLSILNKAGAQSVPDFSSLETIPASSIIQVLPQLTAYIDHKDSQIRNVISKIIENASVDFFQDVYLTLYFYTEYDDEKGEIASDIISKITNLSQDTLKKAYDSDLFIDGMIRSAQSMFEIWEHSIEAAVNALKEGNRRKSDNILVSLFSIRPKCELDRLFTNLYSDVVKQCCSLFDKGDKNSIKTMWTKLRTFYTTLKVKIRKLSVIFLSKISEKLAAKEHFSIDIPGITGERMQSIAPVMDVMDTQQHPRILFIHSESGKKFKFLLKGNEDLRLDKRIMQLFALMNGLFSHNLVAREYDFAIQRYAIIPLTKSAGLIQWFLGADTIHQLVIEYRSLKGIPSDVENQSIKKVQDVEMVSLSVPQRMELFEYIAPLHPANELFESIWYKSSNSAVWLARTQRFTISYALMAMAGYLIGLGDRHPSNIMIQRETGSIVHIDFGESFESAITRRLHPEKVPFRLTRMIVNALEGGISSGFFRDICEKTMHVFRDNSWSLSSQLAIFTDDPITEKRTTTKLKRCFEKLNGKEFSEIETVSVEEQVDILIKTAEDPGNYMRHYPGWCPLW